MGKKLIIPNADFSANCIVIPCIMTVKANSTVTWKDVTYGPYDEDTDIEFPELQNPAGFGGETFPGIKKLYYGVEYSGTTINHSKLSDLVSVYYAKTINVTTLESIYNECTNLLKADLSKFNLSSVSSIANSFRKCSSLKEIIFPQNMNLSNAQFTSTFLSNCSSLRRVIAPSLLSTDKDITDTDTYKIAFTIQYSSSTSVDLVCSDATIHWNGSSWS